MTVSYIIRRERKGKRSQYLLSISYNVFVWSFDPSDAINFFPDTGRLLARDLKEFRFARVELVEYVKGVGVVE